MNFLTRSISDNNRENHCPAGKDSVNPGDVVWMKIDLRSARDFGGPNVVGHLEREYPNDPVPEPENTFFTFDTVAPANNIPYAKNQHTCRTFARKWKTHLYDVNSGIGTHTLIEKGLVRPGMTAIGTDSHYNIMGAIGAFGQGTGDVDTAFAFKTGKIWFEVPKSNKITLTGIPKHPLVSPKDIALKLLMEFGAAGLLGSSTELYGEYIDGLDLDGRITIASLGTEMGLISLMIPPSEGILNEIKKIKPEANLEPVYADNNAKYQKEYTIDISDLEPLIAVPFAPHNVHTVREYIGTKVDSVFVGSCTNGRISDINQVHEILKDKKVADDTILRIVPTTHSEQIELLTSKTAIDLVESGAVFSHPACAGCASGQIGMTGVGEVQVSTGNRNFKGKQGAGETYLASPLVAAYAALKGEIWLPEV